MWSANVPHPIVFCSLLLYTILLFFFVCCSTLQHTATHNTRATWGMAESGMVCECFASECVLYSFILREFLASWKFWSERPSFSLHVATLYVRVTHKLFIKSTHNTQNTNNIQNTNSQHTESTSWQPTKHKATHKKKLTKHKLYDHSNTQNSKQHTKHKLTKHRRCITATHKTQAHKT